MKYVLICVLVGVSLLAVGVSADAVMTTRGVFKENVRQQERIESTYSLPDTAFNDFVNRALVWTSVDCGGVQSRVRMLTVKDRKFYAFPDTVVEVLAQALFSGTNSFSIRGVYPQFSEELGYPTVLTPMTTDPSVRPTGFIYWDDTLQLIAIPTKVDTLYFYCHVEHPALSADSMVIRLKPAYSEAALYYCCFLISESLEEFEDAAYFEARYEKTRAKLRALYQPKFDILK